MNKKILERRRNLLNLRCNGVLLSEAVKSLSAKYGVSERQVYADWRCRSRWMSWFVDLGKGSDALRDVLARHESIYASASREYRSAQNDSARIGALRLMRDLDTDLVEFMVTGDLLSRVEALEEVKGVNPDEYR
jgi:hypothetical protein